MTIPIPVAEEHLDEACRNAGVEFTLTADTATDCAWAAALTLSAPVDHGRADEVTPGRVLRTAGHPGAGEAIAAVLAAAITTLEDQ